MGLKNLWQRLFSLKSAEKEEKNQKPIQPPRIDIPLSEISTEELVLLLDFNDATSLQDLVEVCRAVEGHWGIVIPFMSKSKNRNRYIIMSGSSELYH